MLRCEEPVPLDPNPAKASPDEFFLAVLRGILDALF